MDLDDFILQTERQQPKLLEGLLSRGLKSCSANYEALSSSLVSLQHLIQLDLNDKLCTIPFDSEERLLSRFFSHGGPELLNEAQKHAQIEIYW